jgi:Zn finger protein HypA/HybF involved in hydrogenase expression
MSQQNVSQKNVSQQNVSAEATFQCLRCGHRFQAAYAPKVVEERSCPRCASNSVRRIKGTSS